MDATELLVVDVQQGIVERFADDDGYLPRLGRAITAARAAGIPVIYVTVGFRPGHRGRVGGPGRVALPRTAHLLWA